MSWVEVFKINSDMSKPLNTYISELISGLTTLVNTVNTNVTNTKTQVGTVNTTVNTINTTVNTINTKVQSLDKLIEAQTRMVASDAPYVVITGGSVVTEPVNTEVSLTLPTKIKMTRPGTARFTGVLRRTTYTKMRGAIIIYKNGAEVYRDSYAPEFGTGSDTFTVDLSFVPGDIFSFKITGLNNTSSSNSRSVSVESINLNGTIEHNVCEII